ncbi:MAG: hypothetical protein RIB59_10775 [Rhodospirillales bacterium]
MNTSFTPSGTSNVFLYGLTEKTATGVGATPSHRNRHKFLIWLDDSNRLLLCKSHSLTKRGNKDQPRVGLFFRYGAKAQKYAENGDQCLYYKGV